MQRLEYVQKTRQNVDGMQDQGGIEQRNNKTPDRFLMYCPSLHRYWITLLFCLDGVIRRNQHNLPKSPQNQALLIVINEYQLATEYAIRSTALFKYYDFLFFFLLTHPPPSTSQPPCSSYSIRCLFNQVVLRIIEAKRPFFRAYSHLSSIITKIHEQHIRQ